MAAKISLFIMARNAGRTIEACLKSALPYVDEVVVAGGGQSTDGTLQIANDLCFNWAREKYGEDPDKWDTKPYRVIQLDWHDDFARARNEGWQHLAGDYALWLDADDILEGGENLRAYTAQPQTNCWFAPYHYEQDDQGNLSATLWRERLVKDPQTYKWNGAIHEFLELDKDVPLVLGQMLDVVVRHNPERDRDKGSRNLDILYRELARTEPNPDQRVLFYLGRENAARGNLKEALLHLNRYISQARFDDEAYQMAYMVADILRTARRYPEAQKAALQAIEMRPGWPDAYFLLARLAYEQRKFEEAVEWTKAGATKDLPRTSVIIDPRVYTYWPYYYLGLAYLGMGDHEMAMENLERAASVIADEEILGYIAQCRAALGTARVRDAFLTLYEHLGRNDEWLKARDLFRVAPKAIELDDAVRDAHLRTLVSTAHVEDPQIMVDFYRNNPGWAPMSDEVLWSDKWLQHPRLAFARKSITCDPPATILDVGSSDGFISLRIAQDGHIVEGWDLDPRCVELANKRAKEKGLRAHYSVGSIEDVEGKYDVALAFEIIEHLVDPDAFLDRVDAVARKVVITTPHLAWERGQTPEWRKVEPKGHLRIFDLDDLEARLAHRGRIFDLYVEPWGGTGWLFASYRPRQSYARTVTFLAPGTLEEWSPRKLAAEGLGGSETALIRLAEELFYAGGEDTNSSLCTVYGRIDSPGYYNGVRYRGMESFDPSTNSDVLVAWRYPEAADLALRTQRLVLWMHDTDAGERLTPVRAARFEKIVVLSEWHYKHMVKVYPWLDPDKLVIIGNGVDVERFAPLTPKGGSRRQGGGPVKREPHRVAYTSSPDRGLDVVLEHVWPKVIERVPDAELHVYYGMNNLDVLAPNYPQIAAFQQRLRNLIADSKGVVQHGRVDQQTLARDLLNTSIWLYPSHNFDETFCISAIEAQLAGCIPVTTNRGALAETVASGVVIEGTIGQSGVAEQYVDAVVSVLTGDSKVVSKLRRETRQSAPAHDWADIAGEWNSMVLSDSTE